LAVQAAEALRELAEEYQPLDGRPEFLEVLAAAAAALVRAQPVMAPIVNLANQVLLQASDIKGSPQAVQITAARACNEFIGQTAEFDQNLHRKAAGVIRNDDTVLTHSYSSAVAKALIAAHRQGRKIIVICTESRPFYEGRTLALELADQGIPVRYIADAAVGLFIAEADMVMVGADSVTEDGLVNKIGTCPLAAVAQAAGIDVYALCTTTKFVPGTLPRLPQLRKGGPELWEDCPDGITPVNFYFDLTPLKNCTGIITENGVQKAEQVLAQLRSWRVHPLLAQTLHDMVQGEPRPGAES